MAANIVSSAPATGLPASASNWNPRASRQTRRGRNIPVSDAAHHLSEETPLRRQIRGERVFGGQLTRPAGLDGGAVEFVPASLPPSFSSNSHPKKQNGHIAQPKAASGADGTLKSNVKHAARTKRRASILRSTAPDITIRIHEDVANGIYECAICTNEVARNSKVWSCRTCWTVFHLGCIKKWCKNEGSAAQAQGQDQDVQVSRQWRCPGCNLPKETHPSSYNCWCEKELDPKVIGGLPPHSCGQTCGRERMFPKPCPHPCDLLCHAGPCPPCTSIGPPQSCFCGRESRQKPCLQTSYEFGWTCGQPCGDLMPCGDHSCPQTCHEGLCGACNEDVDVKCYCGKVQKTIRCHEREAEKDSHSWVGTVDCHQECGRLMDCGQHSCEKPCHPQDAETPHCPHSPDIVKTCPCGKTPLSSMNAAPRQICTDLIPNCQKACEKTLACGHECQQVCHTGLCLPCLRVVDITCRCSRSQFKSICHQGKEEAPQCMRICRATLNCSRHECGERCCTGERRAHERQSTKKKPRPLGSVTRIVDEGVEAEHICTKICGRMLKCGNHTCPDLCHKGPCNSCREAIFEDIYCNCGRTSLQAPLPCGTKPPPCNFPCHRSKSCGHPQVAHNCHHDDEACPKCPFLTEKQCMCGKSTLKNQPCWRKDVSCGLVCGGKLKCGSHICQKLCHPSGQCEDAQQPCQQTCGKEKKTCGHPCEKPCHAPSACKEDRACPFKTMITCDCQRKKEEVKCNARAGVPDPPGRENSLKCDEECDRLTRNRRLAAALKIDEDHIDEHVPYSNDTLILYAGGTSWANKQEAELRVFAADEDEKRLRFKPMKARQRQFLHSVAEDFGFDSESMDPEPHRHVMIFKTPRFVSAPMKTLAQAARLRKITAASANAMTSTATARSIEARNEYNGILLLKPQFALTEEELRPKIIKAAPTTLFETHFLDDAVALIPSYEGNTSEQTTTLINSLIPTVAAEVTKNNIAEAATPCMFDTSGPLPVILEQKTINSTASGGWSKVASKGASPARAPQVKPVGQRPAYTILGTRLQEAKRKKQEEAERRKIEALPVAESWEEAEDEEEGKEGNREEVHAAHKIQDIEEKSVNSK